MYSQLKIEKVSSFDKYNSIKSLEYFIIKIGHDPKEIKATKELIKNKEADIQELKKQLKLPSTEHPQAKEVANIEIEKEKTLYYSSGAKCTYSKVEARHGSIVERKRTVECSRSIYIRKRYSGRNFSNAYNFRIYRRALDELPTV